MREMMSFNEMYRRYSLGLLERKKFEGMIFENILANFHCYNFYGWEKDEYNDFVSWLYPRLKKAIDGYQETGSAFENYINAMIRLTAREYRCRKTERSNNEYAAWTVRINDMYACDGEPEYSAGTEYPLEPEEEPLIKKARNPRQLLILVLKCYQYISDDLLKRLAPRLKIQKDELKKMLDQIRKIRLKRDENIRLLRERIHCQFFRCLVYERRLKFMPEDSGAAYKMKLQLERARQRLESMRKRLAMSKPGPSNQQIADIIGLTKGAVDASLYSLKSRWKNGAKTAILN